MNDAKIEFLLNHVPVSHIQTTINTFEDYEPPENEEDCRQEMRMLLEYGVKEVRGTIAALEMGVFVSDDPQKMLEQRRYSLACLEAAQYLADDNSFH